MTAPGRRLVTRQEVKQGLVPPGSFVACPVEQCFYAVPIQGTDPESARPAILDHVEWQHIEEDAGVALIKLRVEAVVHVG